MYEDWLDWKVAFYSRVATLEGVEMLIRECYDYVVIWQKKNAVIGISLTKEEAWGKRNQFAEKYPNETFLVNHSKQWRLKLKLSEKLKGKHYEA